MITKTSYCLVPCLFFFLVVFSQAPPLQWQKCYGGSGFEACYGMQQTTDGGYILAGTGSIVSGDISFNNGLADYWIVKLDDAGVIEWQRSYGGSGFDIATSIRQTPDEGYIIAGYSNSTDADVGMNYGNFDYWIIKLDASGNITWKKVLGGSGIDQPNSVLVTGDGGYIVAGASTSNNGDVTGNHGIYDYWVVKLNATGNLVWQRSFGGNLEDIPYNIQQTTDGGYVIAGYSNSSNGDITGSHGGSDCWIVKLDATGNLLWQKALGGSQQDHAYYALQTADGGYVVAGDAKSTNGDVTGNHGNYDCWITKLDATGNLQWQRSIGGTEDDWANCIIPVPDGYIVGGNTGSDNGDATANNGLDDYWVFKITGAGALVWEKNYGGLHSDQAYAIQLTTDNGFIMAGNTDSDNTGNVGDNHGMDDIWIVKLKPMGPVPVTLHRFEASIRGDEVQCNWQTFSEQHAVSFIIQRSDDALNFMDIGSVAAAGFSSVPRNYDYIDKDAFTRGASNLYYRLKIVCGDNEVSYSNIDHIKPNCYQLVGIYPNPVVNWLQLNFTACENEKATIIITGITGRKYLTLNFSIKKGFNSYPLNVAALPQGEYIVRVIGAGNYSGKFIKTGQ